MDTGTLKDILLVVLGGLFGWTLGQLPKKWVFVVLAIAIIIIIILLAKS